MCIFEFSVDRLIPRSKRFGLRSGSGLGLGSTCPILKPLSVKKGDKTFLSQIVFIYFPS
jgi:hypothetical protein